MNRWQQERAIEAAFISMEAEGLACKVDGKWQLTETGQRVAREEMAEDFGIWAPLVRLLDRVKAGGCCLTDRSNVKFSNVINGSILPKVGGNLTTEVPSGFPAIVLCATSGIGNGK